MTDLPLNNPFSHKISNVKYPKVQWLMIGLKYGNLSRFLTLSICLALLTFFPTIDSKGEVTGHDSKEIRPEKRRVLVLNAYHPGYHWADRLMEGVDQVFEGHQKDVELFVDYMDTKRSSDVGYYEKLKALYIHKYSQIPMDVIVACDDNALDFLLKYRDEIFPNVPVSFCGIVDYQNERIEGHQGYTGVYESFDAIGTINLIQKYHPEVREIVVISDASESAKALLSHMYRAENTTMDRVKLRFFTDLAKAELAKELGEISPEAAIIWTIHLKFPDGYPMTVTDSLSWIRSHCSNPIYCIWDVVGMGVVGGRISSPQYQGAEASRIALRILSGEKPSEIPIAGSPMVDKFDYNELRNYGLQIRLLAGKRILINDPLLDYKRHKWLILTSAIFVLVLLVMLSILIYLYRRSTRAEATTRDANTELQSAKEKAEESDRLKSAFLSNLSHEIRTPMNGLLGFVQLLKDDETSKVERHQFIETIQSSGERMIALIESLINLSKIESGIERVEASEFQIVELLQYVVHYFEPQADTKGIQLQINQQSAKLSESITTDREKLEQILFNLVKNALKYTESGHIELGFELREKSILFFVEDTGIGIDKDKLELIFERFRRIDDEDYRGIDGIGLGLSISKAFVELLGGEMHVTSTIDKGSVFSFVIPRESFVGISN